MCTHNACITCTSVHVVVDALKIAVGGVCVFVCVCVCVYVCVCVHACVCVRPTHRTSEMPMCISIVVTEKNLYLTN